MRKPRPRLFLLVAFFAFVVGALPTQAATLQCLHLPQLFEYYLRTHYQYKQLSDTIKAHTVEQYLKMLDPSKTHLLDEDIDKLRKAVSTVFTTMQTGSCTGLEESSKLILQRAKENETFVKAMLGPDYKLDESTELIIDPQKRGYPKSAKEKEELLRKMVHFQISNYLLTSVKLPEAKKQLIHRYELIVKRLNERKPEDVIANFAEAFAQGLDPHSSFLSRDNLEDFRISMELSLEGIGASLSSQDGFTVIEELIPGGGAERTKQLQPKDKILAVVQDGEKPVNVIDMDLRDVVKMIRGKKGTRVTLTILRQAEKTKTFDVSIVRDKIDIKEQAAKITYETRKVGAKEYKIGIIDLPSFYGGGGKEGSRSCSRDVKKLLVEAKEKKVDGIVLNLSRNGGGLLEEAVKISGFFLAKGSVVATKDTDAKVQVLSDDDADVTWSGPLAVLISRLSASASEILAGVLRDYKRAIIVGGDHTFGKGSVQVVSGLPMELGGMKVTTGMFFLPAGASTQHSGVVSDIQMPSPFSTEEIGESKLDYSLPPQSIAPFLSTSANPAGQGHWEPFTESAVKKAAEKSKERVAKEPKFAEIKKTLEETKKNNGTIKLSELRKKSKAEKKTEKKEDSKKPKDADLPLVKESVNILVDLMSTPAAS